MNEPAVFDEFDQPCAFVYLPMQHCVNHVCPCPTCCILVKHAGRQDSEMKRSIDVQIVALAPCCHTLEQLKSRMPAICGCPPPTGTACPRPITAANPTPQRDNGLQSKQTACAQVHISRMAALDIKFPASNEECSAPAANDRAHLRPHYTSHPTSDDV